MWVFAALDIAALLLGIAAVVSAIGGCVSTILAIRKSRDEETEKCLERLKVAREEAEALALEKYERIMKEAKGES